MKTLNEILWQSEASPLGQLSTFEAHDSGYFEKLVAYCSDQVGLACPFFSLSHECFPSQAHSSVDKGIMLCGVKIRKLPTSKDNKMGNFTLKAETLEAAIKVGKR
jgi:hypothetical protein